MTKLKRVKLKKGMGGFLRLTMPGFSLTIDGNGEKDVTDEEYARVQQYVDVVPVKPVPPPKKTSEVKSLDTSKE